jgi:ADP-heptose:LPS heptosyltransferase
MVLDFQGLIKSGVWAYLSRGRRRIGFSNAREHSHLFYNEKLPPYDPERHAVDRYLDMARYAGGVVDESVFRFDPGPEAARGAQEALEEEGVGDGGFFIVAARARWETKLWSDEKFAGLARRIIDKTGLKAVLVGGMSDFEGLEWLKARIGEGAFNLAGATSLKEFAALSSMAGFVVTVDSGPMHIAAAAGARVVAIFGPTAPWRTGPYGNGHIVVRKDLDCSPCFRKSCEDKKRCMELITIDDVMEAVEKLLGRGASA